MSVRGLPNENQWRRNCKGRALNKWQTTHLLYLKLFYLMITVRIKDRTSRIYDKRFWLGEFWGRTVDFPSPLHPAAVFAPDIWKCLLFLTSNAYAWSCPCSRSSARRGRGHFHLSPSPQILLSLMAKLQEYKGVWMLSGLWGVRSKYLVVNMDYRDLLDILKISRLSERA